MRKFLIFMALCAVCTAAPTPIEVKDDALVRPSPINPDVVSDPKPDDKIVLLNQEHHHRQKRDEAATADSKPHSVQAHELLQHNPHSHHEEKPVGVLAHESLQHDHKKEKRDATEKPTTAAAHESLQHDAHANDHAKPESHSHHDEKTVGVLAHESLEQDHKKLKRDATEKPTSVAAHESLQHDAHAHDHAKPESVQAHDALQHDDKKPKREAPASICAEPHSAKTLEGVQHDNQKSKRESPAHGCHDAFVGTTKPDTTLAHTELPEHDQAKFKREATEKPASVAAHQSLQHDAHAHDHAKSQSVAAQPHSAQAHEGLQHELAKPKRDIPVPTQIKTTSVPKEEKQSHESSSDHFANSTPHSPLRHHPVPVAELFNKPKSTAKPSSDSSEESKKSKESQ